MLYYRQEKQTKATKTWTDNVKEDLRTLNIDITDVTDLTIDRTLWMHLVHNHPQFVEFFTDVAKFLGEGEVASFKSSAQGQGHRSK